MEFGLNVSYWGNFAFNGGASFLHVLEGTVGMRVCGCILFRSRSVDSG